ncbi:hypothetical protein GCM10027318_33110 [Massilia agilis]
MTVLLYEDAGFVGLDVEPAGSDREKAVLRLLRRQMIVTTPHRIAYWSASDNRFPEEVIASCAPDAILTKLSRACWE